MIIINGTNNDVISLQVSKALIRGELANSSHVQLSNDYDVLTIYIKVANHCHEYFDPYSSP